MTLWVDPSQNDCVQMFHRTLVLPSPPIFSFSSLPLQKYVQDALREQLAETVYHYLREEGGHIYVCGDVTMAGDVLKTVQHIMKQQGNMSLEDAGFFISRLRVRMAPLPSSSLCSSSSCSSCLPLLLNPGWEPLPRGHFRRDPTDLWGHQQAALRVHRLHRGK